MWLQGQQTRRLAVAPDQDDQSGPGRTVVVGDRCGDVVDGQRGLCGRSSTAWAGAGGGGGAAGRPQPCERTCTAARGELLSTRAAGAAGGAMRGAGTAAGAVDPRTVAQKS